MTTTKGFSTLRGMNCTECDTRNADVLPSRGDCQTCLKARLDALDKVLRPEPHADCDCSQCLGPWY